MQKDLYNVEIVEHVPWDTNNIQSEVTTILDRCEQLYTKLLSSVQGADRVTAVRHRVLCEKGETAAKFSRDHPRLFGLISGENVDRSQVMTLLQLHQSDTDGQEFAKQMLKTFTKNKPS